MQEAKVLFSVTRQIKNPLGNQGVIGLALREGWEASPPGREVCRFILLASRSAASSLRTTPDPVVNRDFQRKPYLLLISSFLCSCLPFMVFQRIGFCSC